MATIQTEKKMLGNNEKKTVSLSRRQFFGYAGTTTALVVGLAACTKTEDAGARVGAESVDLGTNDQGILNYAYALEQLEAAFYVKVLTSPYANMTSAETVTLSDVRDHEIAHREFFKNALAAGAIQKLDFDFSSVDFTSRASVLGTAMAFEDVGVSAYNGAGRLIKSANYLVLAGKIVSVEARHASYIRDLVKYNSFADDSVVDGNGLDLTRKPLEVLTIVQKYIVQTINGSNLPFY